MKEIDVSKHISIDVALAAITDYISMLHNELGIIDDKELEIIKYRKGCRIEDIPFDQYKEPYPIPKNDDVKGIIIHYPVSVGDILIQDERELELFLKTIDKFIRFIEKK